MVKKLLSVVIIGLFVAGCAGKGVTTQHTIEKEVDGPEIITQKRFNELVNIKPPAGPIIPIAVYRFNNSLYLLFKSSVVNFDKSGVSGCDITSLPGPYSRYKKDQNCHPDSELLVCVHFQQ